MNESWHPGEEDLILHYYGESTSPDDRTFEDHLRACPSCRAAWQELSETMALVDEARVPEPSEDFERVMWARISRELPPRRAGWSSKSLVVFGALAAVLIALITAGYSWTRVQPAPAGMVAEDARPTSSDPRERVLLTALDEHLAQTEMLLVELKNTTDAGASQAAFERATADDLVASGRLYRATARETGQAQVVQLLDDLEGVLVEVARSPDPRDQDNFKFLRARIDDDDLLFKVRAVTAEVRDRQQTLMTQQ